MQAQTGVTDGDASPDRRPDEQRLEKIFCALRRAEFIAYNTGLHGEVDERFKSHAWKACVG